MRAFATMKSMNIQNFLKDVPKEKKDIFKKLHELILKAAPDLVPFNLQNYLAYGKYHYRYKSGREGDWFTVALKNNKNTIGVYFCSMVDDKYLPEVYEKELKAKVGKSCINFKKVEDIDFKLLEKMIKQANKLYEPVQVQ